jgi:hypothetical protein
VRACARPNRVDRRPVRASSYRALEEDDYTQSLAKKTKYCIFGKEMKRMIILFALFSFICIGYACTEEKIQFILSKNDLRLYVENKRDTTLIVGRDIKESTIITDSNGMLILKIVFTKNGKDIFSRITTENGNRLLVIDTIHNDQLFLLKIWEPMISESIYVSISEPAKLDQLLLCVGNKRMN